MSRFRKDNSFDIEDLFQVNVIPVRVAPYGMSSEVDECYDWLDSRPWTRISAEEANANCSCLHLIEDSYKVYYFPSFLQSMSKEDLSNTTHSLCSLVSVYYLTCTQNPNREMRVTISKKSTEDVFIRLLSKDQKLLALAYFMALDISVRCDVMVKLAIRSLKYYDK